MSNRFDPGKDAINQIRHGFSLGFGDRIFDDKLHTGVWRNDLLVSARRSNKNEARAHHSR